MAIPSFSKKLAAGAVRSLPGGNLALAGVEALSGSGKKKSSGIRHRKRYRPLSSTLRADIAYVKSELGEKTAQAYLLQHKR